MSDQYIVRDQHTLKVLATYDTREALYADWFTYGGDWWIPKGEIVATKAGGFADWVFEMAKGQGDPDAGG